MQTFIWIAIAFAVLAAFAVLPRNGLVARWRALRQRARFEDALKHLLDLSQRGRMATHESLAGALGLSQNALVDLIARMESHGVIQSTAGGLRLTPEGERTALQIVRAHRLWERYFLDEARVPLSRVHEAAEKAEHGMTPERLDALEAHLGHPLHDPHGDPIPRADGSMVTNGGIELNDFPTGVQAEIVHLEDEPDVVFQQILALGLRPGSTIRAIGSTPQYLLVSDGEQEHRIAPVVAANIHVKEAPWTSSIPAGSVSLADLHDGEEAEVIDIDSSYRGLGRRRLLDLGLTPRTKVRAELATAFGDPRAYRVRGTVVALRNDQARQVWVHKLVAEAVHS